LAKCRVCGREVPSGLHYCSKECQEKDLKTLTANTEVEADFKTALLDPHYMRGLIWRKDKLEAIHKAFQSGLDEEAILRILMRGGLTRLTAKKLIADSKAVYSNEG